MCNIYHVCFLGAANSMISYTSNGWLLLFPPVPWKSRMHTRLGNVKVFSWTCLDFLCLLSHLRLFYRCFLSDSCWHPGGHTWSALHLEHLQTIIARESPLHTWYTCCSPLSERSKSRRERKKLWKSNTHTSLLTYLHWLFMHLKSSWIFCSYRYK